jgi:hypothetical protein
LVKRALSAQAVLRVSFQREARPEVEFPSRVNDLIAAHLS